MFINSDTNLASAPLLEAMNALVAAGKWDPGDVAIDSTFALKDTAAAFERSQTGHVVGKVSVVVRSASAR